jgi:hypothetical protein
MMLWERGRRSGELNSATICIARRGVNDLTCEWTRYRSRDVQPNQMRCGI